MKLIEFPEQTMIIAKDQPQYMPMPAFLDINDPEGRVVCCWRLTFRERLKVLVTGKIWQHILTFRKPMQPQLLQTAYPFNNTD